MASESFAPVEPGQPVASTVSTPPPPVIAAPRKQDRTFRILLADGLLVAVGGVAFAVGRVSAPAAAATNRSNFGAGGFPNAGAGAGGGTGGAGLGRGGFGGFGGGVLVTGTVDSISGTTMTLKESNGNTVTVNLAATTTYHSQAAATAADVTAGKQVQVEVQIAGGFGGVGGQGAPGASPNVAASPAAGGNGATTRTITARDITLVTP